MKDKSEFGAGIYSVMEQTLRFEPVIGAEDDHEAKLRDKHPGLNEAWEKYQTLLKLVKE